MSQPVTTNPFIIMLINMTVVFLVLIALGVVINLIHYFDPTKPKAKPEEAPAPAPAPAPAVKAAPEPVKEEAAPIPEVKTEEPKLEEVKPKLEPVETPKKGKEKKA
jgi:glutaconyl-CoA decarboxylase